MTDQRKPEFRTLDRNDIQSVLARNSVGRLAFDGADGVDIRPLHFAYSEGNIYGRTSPEAAFVRQAAGGKRVAFEVDEVETVFHWTSVIVRGQLRLLSPDGPEAAEWGRAAELLRRVVKETLVPGDPVPERSVIFRITVEEVTGRASR